MSELVRGVRDRVRWGKRGGGGEKSTNQKQKSIRGEIYHELGVGDGIRVRVSGKLSTPADR